MEDTKSKRRRTLQDSRVLLTDDQMQQFLVDGFLVLQPRLDDDVHDTILNQAKNLSEEQGGLFRVGNNILPRVDRLQDLLKDPVVDGALQSVLGPNYLLQAHRHCHVAGEEQPWHKDSMASHWRPLRSPFVRYAMIMYYPQETTQEMGPTEFKAKSQYYTRNPREFDGGPPREWSSANVTGLRHDHMHERDTKKSVVPKGAVVLLHFDLTHRGTRPINKSAQKRYMFKLQFSRMEAPSHSGTPLWQCPSDATWRGLSAETSGLMGFHVWNWLRGVKLERSDAMKIFGTSDQRSGRLDYSIEKMRDQDEETRHISAFKLACVGDETELERVVEMLEEEDCEVRTLAAHALAAACLYHKGAVTLVLQKLQASIKEKNFFTAAHAAFILGETGCESASAEDRMVVINALVQLLDLVSPDRCKQSHGYSSYASYYACEALGICMSCLGNEAAREVSTKVLEALVRTVSQTYHPGNPMPHFAAGLALAKLAPLLFSEALAKLPELVPSGSEAVQGLIYAMEDDDRYVSYHALCALTRSGNLEALKAANAFLMEQRWCSFTANGQPY